MGSGSRIDHQHHLVATTVGGPTVELPAGPLTLAHEPAAGQTEVTPHQQLLARLVYLVARTADGTATAEQLTELADGREQLRREYGDAAVPTPGEAVSTASAMPAPGAPEAGPAPRQPAEAAAPRAAAQQVLDEVAEEHAAAAALQVQARDRWPAPDNDTSYEHDFDAFRTAYRQARERIAAGEEAIPYFTQDATGGLGARDGGRGFGVEIEFDIVSDRPWDGDEVGNIARALHRAGLTQTARQHEYHTQRARGYTDAPDGWRLERDDTVGAELVSPILYDEPQTWENLETVCRIIQEHGGRATAQTGGHVHVGMPDFDHDVDRYHRLMDTYKTHEDVLYRLAQNPASQTGRHRGVGWCHPNTVPASGYTSMGAITAHHGQAVNLDGARRGDASAHGEFRLWDGSLTPSVIQAQVNLSLGLVAAAARRPEAPAIPAERMELGSHLAQLRAAGLRPRSRLNGEAWRASTLSFRRLADEVFHRAQDKAQATALFASTRWQQR